jgi:hypothetical protein
VGTLRQVLRPEALGAPRMARAVCVLVACAMAYGAVMGSYAGRMEQALYAALKVPLLLMVSFALGLPSFFVLGSLLGLRADAGRAFRALLRSQAALAVALAALAPYTALVYVSGVGYQAALLFNAGMFAAASLGAQLLLRELYRPLVAKNPRHRWSLRLWFLTYAFVGIQLGWVLRPFVGSPSSPVRFVREEAWGNAYLVVWRLLRDLWG